MPRFSARTSDLDCFRARARQMPLPTEIMFNGVAISMLTFEQLEQMSRQNLKNRVRTLQDQLGSSHLPPVTGHGQDLTIEWILEVQCAVCKGKGLALTPKDFGAPAASNQEGFFGRGEAMPQSKKHADQWSHSNDMPRQPMQDQSNATAMGAYEDACNGAALARQRNAGSNIFG